MTKRVFLIGGQGPYKEGTATEAITPGMLVEETVDGTVQMNDTTLRVNPLFAVENDIFGGSLEDAYAADDTVIYQVAQPGDEVYALLPAAASAVVFGDLVTAAAGGVVIKTTTKADAIGKAQEAVDNSAGGALARLRIEIF